MSKTIFDSGRGRYRPRNRQAKPVAYWNWSTTNSASVSPSPKACLGGGAIDATGVLCPKTPRKPKPQTPSCSARSEVQEPSRWPTVPEKVCWASAPVLNPSPTCVPPSSTCNCARLEPETRTGSLLDIPIVRELTGDIYFGKPRGVRTRKRRTRLQQPQSTANLKSAASAR